MNNLDDVNYKDMLAYAHKLSDKQMEFLPDSVKADKESLAQWISNNEPNYDPEDENK